MDTQQNTQQQLDKLTREVQILRELMHKDEFSDLKIFRKKILFQGGILGTGSVTMVAGVATISDSLITTTSRIIYSRSTFPSGTMGNLWIYSQVAGTAVIKSDQVTDVSTLNYIILT